MFIQVFNSKEYTIGFKLSLYKFLNQSVYFYFHRAKSSKVKSKDRTFEALLANTQPALFPNMPENVSFGSLLIPKAYIIFLWEKTLTRLLLPYPKAYSFRCSIVVTSTLDEVVKVTYKNNLLRS